MPGPFSRRRFLCIGAVTASLPVVGYTVAGFHSERGEPRAEYQNDDQIAYEHESLNLQLLQESVQIEETAEFEVTNTDESEITLGCRNPWALQRQLDGEWRHLTRTGGDYYKLCATVLSPGATLTDEVPLSESELEQRANNVQTALQPGMYRFVLLGPSPFYALDFSVLDSE